MFKLVVKAMLALGIMMSVPACAVAPEDTAAEPELSVTEQAIGTPTIIVFEKKSIFETWKNVCKDLEGVTFSVTIDGCTISRTYRNCRRGAQNGVCHCDEQVTASGSC